MSQWRPQHFISVKAIGLLWREGRLLAAEVRDDAGRLTGVRPLGGGVAFGETAEDAVIREFQEELGLAVTPVGPPVVLQNIYVHEGTPGHEIIFAFRLLCAVAELPSATTFEFAEDEGTLVTASWHLPDEFGRPGGPRLYPEGLMRILAQAHCGDSATP